MKPTHHTRFRWWQFWNIVGPAYSNVDPPGGWTSRREWLFGGAMYAMLIAFAAVIIVGGAAFWTYVG